MLKQLNSVLSYYAGRFCEKPSIKTVDRMIHDLRTLRDQAEKLGCLDHFKSACRRHAMFDIIQQDPYSKRAYDKPRGYAGDAVMLDYIYRPREAGSSRFGGVIHKATTQLSNAQSILFRRDYLASLIAGIIKSKPGGNVLSVASGHMRELDAVRLKTTDRSVKISAVDQDSESLGECISSYPDFFIKPLNHSIIELFKSKNVLKATFDLIYSAGLADYLSNRTLSCMLRHLYRSVKPGGMMVIANFTPDSHGRGFMEGFMDWSLTYREEADLIQITKIALPDASCHTFRDDPGNVAYIEIRR